MERIATPELRSREETGDELAGLPVLSLVAKWEIDELTVKTKGFPLNKDVAESPCSRAGLLGWLFPQAFQGYAAILNRVGVVRIDTNGLI
jgi:hypothetical protein